MQVDWFTVAAQLVNFVVLVWLLKRFLYRPVLDAMKARQHKINEAVVQAECQADEADRMAQRLRNDQAGFETDRQRRIDEMKAQVQSERHTLMAMSRRERDEHDRRWREEAAREQQEYGTQLRQSLAVQATAIAQRALQDLAGTDLQSRVIDRFVERLERLDESQHRDLLCGSVRVLTGMSLEDDQRGRLSQVLHRLAPAGSSTELSFGSDPSLGCGISVQSRDFELGWNLRQYMAQVQSHLAQVATEQGEAADAR